MATDDLYYTPPSDKIFEEVRQKSILLWLKYDNTYGYVDEKLEAIQSLKNESDHFMFMVGMFDLPNQAVLAINLTTAARHEVRKRVIAAGVIDRLNMFYE